jgi:hypothetical protein
MGLGGDIVKCSSCGRFMRRGGYYSNDHDDSWTDTWRCSQAPHDDGDRREQESE